MPTPRKTAASTQAVKTSTPPTKKPVARVRRAAVKTSVNAAVKTPVVAAAKIKDVKPLKIKKPKLIRDSFTIPKDEYAVLDVLKQRAGELSKPAKKSELLRAGIKALASMPDAKFISTLNEVPPIKTGRPAKS